MFIGHYGPSFAAKAWKPTIPLWILFLAVQFVDIVWSIFVLLGIEKVRIVPAHRHESFRPLLHAVHAQSAGRARWSVIVALAYRKFFRAPVVCSRRGLSGPPYSRTGVFDLIVHRPDLGLYGDAYKVGFGLWNYPALAFSCWRSFSCSAAFSFISGRRSQRTISAATAC